MKKFDGGVTEAAVAPYGPADALSRLQCERAAAAQSFLKDMDNAKPFGASLRWQSRAVRM